MPLLPIIDKSWAQAERGELIEGHDLIETLHRRRTERTGRKG